MYMRDYPTLRLETTKSKGTASFIVVTHLTVTLGSSLMSETHTLKSVKRSLVCCWAVRFSSFDKCSIWASWYVIYLTLIFKCTVNHFSDLINVAKYSINVFMKSPRAPFNVNDNEKSDIDIYKNHFKTSIHICCVTRFVFCITVHSYNCII